MAVQKGLGVGLLFKSWVQSEIDRGDVRAINVPELKNITSKSFIIHDKRKLLSNSARGFIETLRSMKASVQVKPQQR
jgi:DNA-binding transcriptional LysR family regulator